MAIKRVLVVMPMIEMVDAGESRLSVQLQVGASARFCKTEFPLARH